MALLIGAAVTWAAHSSVATVLLVMSLSAKGVVPPQAAFALTLGANLGTALNPLLEGPNRTDPAARRLPIGNLLTRLAGCIAALAALDWIGPRMVTLQPDTGRAVADFHTLFNVAVALVFFPLLNPLARLLRSWFPPAADASDPSLPIHLDPSARDVPGVALAAATREALRMADMLQVMLQTVESALLHGDRRTLAEAKRLDDVLDRLNTAIAAYLTSLDHDALNRQDERRMAAILTFCTNLEHAGDVIERNLRTASSLLLSEDPRSARVLAEEKRVFREFEDEATETHFARMRAGRADNIAIGALQLDLVRDLKRLNAHLVAAAAYPILRGEGALLPSRVVQDD